MIKIFPLLTPLLFAIGCAKTIPMVLGPDHPASHDAPVASVQPPSTTLALPAPTTVPVASPEQPSHDHAHHAGGTGHDMNSMPVPTTQGGQQQAATYTCPMHPEVVSDKPGKCPKCGMKLVKKEDH
jgi:hypothetical protein